MVDIDQTNKSEENPCTCPGLDVFSTPVNPDILKKSSENLALPRNLPTDVDALTMRMSGVRDTSLQDAQPSLIGLSMAKKSFDSLPDVVKSQPSVSDMSSQINTMQENFNTQIAEVHSINQQLNAIEDQKTQLISTKERFESSINATQNLTDNPEYQNLQTQLSDVESNFQKTDAAYKATTAKLNEMSTASQTLLANAQNTLDLQTDLSELKNITKIEPPQIEIPSIEIPENLSALVRSDIMDITAEEWLNLKKRLIEGIPTSIPSIPPIPEIPEFPGVPAFSGMPMPLPPPSIDIPNENLPNAEKFSELITQKIPAKNLESLLKMRAPNASDALNQMPDALNGESVSNEFGEQISKNLGAKENFMGALPPHPEIPRIPTLQALPPMPELPKFDPVTFVTKIFPNPTQQLSNLKSQFSEQIPDPTQQISGLNEKIPNVGENIGSATQQFKEHIPDLSKQTIKLDLAMIPFMPNFPGIPDLPSQEAIPELPSLPPFQLDASISDLIQTPNTDLLVQSNLSKQSVIDGISSVGMNSKFSSGSDSFSINADETMPTPKELFEKNQFGFSVGGIPTQCPSMPARSAALSMPKLPALNIPFDISSISFPQSTLEIDPTTSCILSSENIQKSFEEQTKTTEPNGTQRPSGQTSKNVISSIMTSMKGCLIVPTVPALQNFESIFSSSYFTWCGAVWQNLRGRVSGYQKSENLAPQMLASATSNAASLMEAQKQALLNNTTVAEQLLNDGSNKFLEAKEQSSNFLAKTSNNPLTCTKECQNKKKKVLAPNTSSPDQIKAAGFFGDPAIALSSGTTTISAGPQSSVFANAQVDNLKLKVESAGGKTATLFKEDLESGLSGSMIQLEDKLRGASLVTLTDMKDLSPQQGALLVEINKNLKRDNVPVIITTPSIGNFCTDPKINTALIEQLCPGGSTFNCCSAQELPKESVYDKPSSSSIKDVFNNRNRT